MEDEEWWESEVEDSSAVSVHGMMLFKTGVEQRFRDWL